MDRIALKNRAKKSFKENYWRCFIVCFLVTLLTGGTILVSVRNQSEILLNESLPLNTIEGKTNSEIVNDFVHGVTQDVIPIENNAGFLGTILDNVSRSGSFLFGVLNAINQFLFKDQIVAGIIIIVGILISILYWIFIAKVLEVGRCRFFLENRLYSKTKVNRMILPYRVRQSMKVSLAMLRKNLYQLLWMFTIVWGPVKFYAYRMVPYLLAENPTLSGKKAIELSQQMMKGHKFEAFLLDCSFFGYFVFGFLTLNLFNLFYTNLYYEATYGEYYMQLRNGYKKANSSVSAFICDVQLEQNLIGRKEYPAQEYFLKEHESRNFFQHLNYNRTYSLESYILLFFTFSMIGWIFEVCLTLFSEGVFVNRGTLLGPWLPIYGSGGVLILFLLQRYRDRPILTFVLTILICGVVEYGTALYLETFKHMKWWDYTGFFLNIQGRVCLEGLLLFGIGGLGFIYLLAPYLDNLFQKWNGTLKRVLCIFLVGLIVCDFWYSSDHPNVGDRITTEISAVLVR